MSATDGVVARKRPVGANAFESLGKHAGERFDIAVQGILAALEAQDQGPPDVFEGMRLVDMPGVLLAGRHAPLGLVANGLGDVVQQDFGRKR